MFKKILIAEDTRSTNDGLVQSLSPLISTIETAQYCDQALLKIKKAVHANDPFELLITDLSFDNSHRKRVLTSGEALISAVKKVHPQIKIMVFSMEYRIAKIKQLLEGFQIHSYIHKSRDDIKEIQSALDHIYNNNTYLSSDVQHLLNNDQNIEEIDEVNIFILKLLSQGIPQKDIPSLLEKNKLPKYQLRSIQERVNNLKELFGANNPAHLVSIAKDEGFI